MDKNSENWLKASVEYENNKFQHLGSVVTNHGYSDWAKIKRIVLKMRLNGLLMPLSDILTFLIAVFLICQTYKELSGTTAKSMEIGKKSSDCLG